MLADERLLPKTACTMGRTRPPKSKSGSSIPKGADFAVDAVQVRRSLDGAALLLRARAKKNFRLSILHDVSALAAMSPLGRFC
jgi:hypothetical protein